MYVVLIPFCQTNWHWVRRTLSQIPFNGEKDILCIILHSDGALFSLRYLTGQQIVIKNHMLDAGFRDK